MYPQAYWQQLCLLGLLCLFGTSAFALHPGGINGYVQDAETGSPLAGATISVPAMAAATITDEMGFFQLSGLTSGTHTLIIRLVGYQTQELNMEIIANETTPLQLTLQPTLIDMEAITILGSSGGIQALEGINKMTLQLRPLKSAQDALTAIPGLFIAQHAGGGKAEQLFLRGFDLDHGTDIRLEVDGQPVNMGSHAHGQGYADLHFVIPETVEGIRYGKGPYDSRYGDFHTAGYVDLRTQDAISSHSMKLEMGQFGHLRGLAMMDILPGKPQQNAYLATEYVSTRGYFDAPQHYQRLNVFGKYTGMIAPNTYLRLSLSHFTSSWDASGQIPMRAVEQGIISRFGAIDSTEGGETSRTNLNLQLSHALQNGGSISQQLAYSRYNFTLFSNFTFFLEDPLNGDQIRQQETRDLFQYQTSYRQQHQLGNIAVASEIGLQLRMDQIDDIELSQTTNRTTLRQRLSYGDIDQRNVGLFFRQNWQLGSRLTLGVGLRYDHLQVSYEDQLTPAYDPRQAHSDVFSPKASLTYTFSPNFQVYLKGGQGFHSNDARLVTSGAVSTLLPRAWGSDLGIIWKPFPTTFVQAAAWGLWSEQEFVYVGDAAIVEASDQSRRLGADLSVRQQFAPWLYADLDVNYTYARGLQDETWTAYIPLAPSLTSTGGLTFRAQPGLEGSIRYRHLADRPANDTFTLTASGYSLLDMVVRYTQDHITIALSVDNMLNQAWEEAQFETTSQLPGEAAASTEIHFTPGSPRFIRTSLQFRF